MERCRAVSRRRPAFHTSPQEAQRQYVSLLTILLLVVTSGEWHVGQCEGAVTACAVSSVLVDRGILIG
jgi:hypothetical protein